LEVEVFRNNHLIPEWKGYEKISTSDDRFGPGKDQQAMARKLALEEYVDLANGQLPPGSSRSDLRDHAVSSALLAGIYESMAARAEGESPFINISLR
jgi:hypothetical protein